MISVIIPVYNTEQYLKQCVDSVLCQSFKDIQIVLIDDGSTDTSGTICDEYSELYKNIVVLHKENGGLSEARNAGILRANGEYILFLDSDDFWADEKGLERLYQSLLEYPCDVLNFQYQKYYENNKLIAKAFPECDLQEFQKAKEKNEQFDFLMSHSWYIASAVNKVVKRELFEKFDLSFEKGDFSEDVEWCAKLAIYAESFGISEVEFYMYRQRESSITHSLKMKNIMDSKKHIENCVKLANRIDKINFRESFLNYVAFQYAVFFVSCGYVSKGNLKQIYQDMKQYEYLLQYQNAGKVAQMAKIHGLVGYKGMCLVARMYAKIRK